MERKKLVIIGTIVAAFAVFVAWAVLTIPDGPPPIQGDPAKAREMEYGENTIREEIGGKLVWELQTSYFFSNISRASLSRMASPMPSALESLERRCS